MIEFICAHCDRTVQRPSYYTSKFKYCSSQCCGLARRDTPEGVGKYLYVWAPGHPLLPSGSTHVGVHRIALWDKIGPGSHPCHHCGDPVTWSPGERTSRGSLVVDHLDRNPKNNDPLNLVPSCHACNSARRQCKRFVRDDELFIVSGRRRLRAVEKTCNECGTAFLAIKSQAAKRRFCGPSCSGKNSRRQQLACHSQ